MKEMKILNPGWSWDADFPLAQGLVVGDTVYLSGQVALSASGEIVGVGDIRAQTRQCFENIGAILAKCGSDFSRIVKLTTFFTIDITDWDLVSGYFEVRKEVFGEHRPASTGVQVQALVYPELMLEIEAIAVRA